MLFFSVKAKLVEPKKYQSKVALKELASITQSRNEAFFQKYNKKVFICIEYIDKSKVNYIMVLNNGYIKEPLNNHLETLLIEYTELIELNCSSYKYEEVTFNGLRLMIHCSWCSDFIKGYDETLKMLGLSNLDESNFEDTIIAEPKSKEQLISEANNLIYSEDLLTEIQRIFKGASKSIAYGLPVHYIIQTDDKEIQLKVMEILISALLVSERITSSRYCTLHCLSEYGHPNDYESVFSATKSGVVLINYEAGREAVGNHVMPAIDIVNRLCTSINKHKYDVQTILCLPLACNDIKEAFLERLGAMTFISFNEEILFGNNAKTYLKNMAKNAGLSPDNSLYRSITNMEKGYRSHELKSDFDRWFSKKLKNNIYPQYADMDSAEKMICLNRKKGSAYSQLDKMIGLEKAKEFISQAIDYYKAQKLFKDKGMKANNISMHMVFTGNPGTAKTTVARLFAQIMKENGLLSIGSLVEVGRADLVGKYVGWTAPTVKAKFEAAKGSVLFIDEAYSLVDGESGLYGDEAINTIVQEMERNREDLVVIFAGYPDKMEQFLNRNPGLKSRIAFRIPFNDYTPEELFKILELMVGDNDMILADTVKNVIIDRFSRASKEENFGNGRYVRNIFEKAKQRQASRLVRMNIESVTRDDVQTLLSEDFEEEMNTLPKKNIIGF